MADMPSTRPPGSAPTGWYLAGSHPDDYSIGVDREAVHGGGASGYIMGGADARSFGTLMQTFTAEAFRGQRRRWAAFVKVNDVVDHAALWMRVDGPDRTIQSFDNMDDRPIVGNTDWEEHRIVLDVPPDAQRIALGLILSGAGRAWIDDAEFELVDESVPVTGARRLPSGPVNLGFDESG